MSFAQETVEELAERLNNLSQGERLRQILKMEIVMALEVEQIRQTVSKLKKSSRKIRKEKRSKIIVSSSTESQ